MRLSFAVGRQELRIRPRMPRRRTQGAPKLRAVHQRYVQLAHRLADAAGDVTRAAFRKPVEIVDKDDLSPVTEIDRRVETSLRAMIHEAFPQHSVYGEEYGMELGHGEDRDYLWILDPIDGTLSFITGKPLYGTLIALLHHGRPILGVIDQPIVKDRWVGVANQPTLHNGMPVHARKCPSLSKAYVYSTTPEMFLEHRARPYEALKSAVKGHLYGADCYAYGLLAMGMVDIVFEADMKVFDYMAMVPIIEGAGGVITDWEGRELVWNGVQNDAQPTWATEILAVGDPALQNESLRTLDYRSPP